MRLNFNLAKATVSGALGGLLFGFDTAVISGAIKALSDLYRLNERAQGFTVSIALVGTVIGALVAGPVGQRLGSRETLRVTAVLYLLSALGCAFALNWPMLLAFRLLGGLGIGASSVLGPVYIAELAPAKWRGRMVGVFQINVVVGILLAYASNYLVREAHLGAAEWRWQLGVAAIPALGFLVLLFGIPRSPRWSVSRARIDEALSVLKSMGADNPKENWRRFNPHCRPNTPWPTSPSSRWKYRYPLFLAITIGAFNQLAGINAILYYPQQHFCPCRVQPGFRRSAGRGHRRHQSGLYAAGHDGDRQTGPAHAAAGRRGGHGGLSGGAWPGSSIPIRTRVRCWGCWWFTSPSSHFRRAR